MAEDDKKISIQFHIRESYYQKLLFLMKNFPHHHYKADWKFLDDRLIQPLLRRKNDEREFAKDPLPMNLPFTGAEPRRNLYVSMSEERAEQFRALLCYHGFRDTNNGKYQNSAFCEALINRRYEKFKADNPKLNEEESSVDTDQLDFDPVAYAMGLGREDKNQAGE